MANELASIQNTLAKMDEAMNSFSITAPDVKKRFVQAGALAVTVGQIRTALSDRVMAEVFMPLKGLSLGFMTDEGNGTPYSIEKTRNVIIEATLLGLMPIGGEFMIMSGRCYTTKVGAKRLVRDVKGLTDLVIKPGIPRMANGGALVDMTATWKLNGKGMSAERKGDNAICVRVNAGQGADAILGKAECKLYKYILGMLTGSDHGVDLDDDVEGGIKNADMKNADYVDVSSVGIEPAPQQSQSETMADKMKKARVTKTKTQPEPTAEAVESEPTPAAAEPETAPPAEPPADNSGDTEQEKAWRAKRLQAEATLKAAEEAGIKVSATPPIVVNGEVIHRNLNKDGTLKDATNAAPAVPQTGTAVDPKRKVVSHLKVNGKMEPIYEDEAKSPALDKLDTRMAAESAAAPAAKSEPKKDPPKTEPVKTQQKPAPATPIPVIVAPKNETGAVEEAVVFLGGVTGPKIKDADGSEKIRFKLADENSTTYYSGDRALAVRAREMYEKKQKVKLTYFDVGGTYWAHSIEPAPEEAQQQDQVSDEDLDNFGNEEANQQPIERTM